MRWTRRLPSRDTDGRQLDVWRFIMESDILGIDLAKQVFQLHGVDRRGRVLHRAKVSRGSLFQSVRTLKPRLVVREACSSAHHWARCFQALGTEVRLVGVIVRFVLFLAVWFEKALSSMSWLLGRSSFSTGPRSLAGRCSVCGHRHIWHEKYENPIKGAHTRVSLADSSYFKCIHGAPPELATLEDGSLTRLATGSSARSCLPRDVRMRVPRRRADRSS